MTRQYHWRDPDALRKVRIRVNVLLVIVIGTMIWLQYDNITRFIQLLK
ncbi:hypothetical protein I5907_10340 [Panacibacter sp. DH6]|uniref:Uncharacterized protein n=1 Tax=Panacibacter microcysteis TaxID=2793269 RepID=A0A931E2Y4_9BACT|nr:hypothetical protein [Panacibacter microcysteis]MBG9376635.1 hypothetical protein [Panacibacter microcysteis]